MAQVQALSDDRRREIARLVGLRADRIQTFSLEPAARLAESLPIAVWNVSAPAEAVSLANLIERTDRWHHQLLQPTTEPAIARTIENDPDSATEMLLVNSPLGAKMDRAIAWADDTADDSWSAQVLFVPRLLSTLLWLEKDGHDRLYVVDAPEGVLVETSEVTAAGISELVASFGEEWKEGLPLPPWQGDA